MASVCLKHIKGGVTSVFAYPNEGGMTSVYVSLNNGWPLYVSLAVKEVWLLCRNKGYVAFVPFSNSEIGMVAF